MILQVIGYKKSGKTTVVNRLIEAANELGLSVAVIKHHGDKSGVEIDIPIKRDHITYIETGALESIVEGYQYVHHLIKKDNKKSAHETVEQLIEQLTTHPDIILIEGYKEAHFNKLVMLRHGDDLNVSHIKYTFKTEQIDTIDYKQIVKEGYNETI